MLMIDQKKICFLIYDGFQLLDLTGPLAVFAGANRALGRAVYRLDVAAEAAGPVISSAALSVMATHSLEQADADLSSTDTLFAIGGEAPELDLALAQGSIVQLLKTASGIVPRLASVCTGAFFLAEAGCLAGHRVATHWWSARRLARRYPELTVDDDAIFIQSGHVWTSAGVTAGIDLALAIVEADHGRETALTIARHLVVPRIRPGGQSQYSAELKLQGEHETRLAMLVQRVRAKPEAAWTVDDLAEEIGVSRRTLSRICRDALDLSPAALVEKIRLDAARRDLVETDDPVERIAERSGFGSAQRMDRVFGRRLGVPPSGFRARFRSPFAQEMLS